MRCAARSAIHVGGSLGFLSSGIASELSETVLVFLVGELATGVALVEDLLRSSSPGPRSRRWRAGIAAARASGTAANQQHDDEDDGQDHGWPDEPHPAHATSVGIHGSHLSSIPGARGLRCIVRRPALGSDRRNVNTPGRCPSLFPVLVVEVAQYTHPSPVRCFVMSVTHNRLGASAVNCRLTRSSKTAGSRPWRCGPRPTVA